MSRLSAGFDPCPFPRNDALRLTAALTLTRDAGGRDERAATEVVHLTKKYLRQHGVKAEVSVLAKSLPRVSDVLARQVRDLDADLLVMGAYGHSRFREAILGGATRNMLEQAEVPVFLAH